MSRNPRLQDWPECLHRLSMDELKRELVHWQHKLRLRGHPYARRKVANRVRDVERELASRAASASRSGGQGPDA
jgi:hypothetical protein